MVREIATPKLLNYRFTDYTNVDKDYANEFEYMGMREFFAYLTNDLEYNKDFSGNHINWWTFEKIKEMLVKSGFNPDNIILSKYMGSVKPQMRNAEKFDCTYPVMSLYVEVIK